MWPPSESPGGGHSLCVGGTGGSGLLAFVGQPRGTIVDRLHSLDYGLDELRRVISTLDDSVMDAPTNCEPWSVRRLASHALNNQLVWAGLVTGQQLVPVEVALGAEPIDGDLEPVAADITIVPWLCGAPTGSSTRCTRHHSVSSPVPR